MSPFMWVALPALVLLAALFGPSCALLVLAALTGEKRSPSDAHPAARAVRGWERISDEEAREFGRIAGRLGREMGADAKWPAAGSDL